MSKKILDLKGMLASSPVEEKQAVIEKAIGQFIIQTIGLGAEAELDYECDFYELGLDSISAVKLSLLITESLSADIEVKSVEIFDHSTVSKLAQHICERLEETGGASATSND